MRHLRFRMRTIFILVTLSAIVSAVSITQAQRQRAAVAGIKRLGGHVLYEASAYDAEPLRLVSWLTRTMGPDWFHSVTTVQLPHATDHTIVLLKGLPDTSNLSLRNASLTEHGIRYITALPKLESLHFEHGALTDDQVALLVSLQRLRHLEVKGTAITDASLPAISHLPAIQSVILDKCNISRRALAICSDSHIAWTITPRPELPTQTTPIDLPISSLKELDANWREEPLLATRRSVNEQ